MKIDANLTLVKGRAAPGPRRPKNLSQSAPTSGAISLISQENRQAWRLDLNSLEEAKRLLGTVKHYLEVTQGDSVAEVHRLDNQCLVRLR